MHADKSKPLALVDQLHEIICRTIALEMAIIGVSREAALNSYGDGLAQLARDISSGLEQFEHAFNAEMSVREHSEKEKL